MKNRERLGSRLGFIMLSAGCAIGCGNVWKFPWMCGQNGGGSFMLLYIICLVVLGLPAMTMEFSVGRAAQASPIRMYQKLEKPGCKWGIFGIASLIGNIALMAFAMMLNDLGMTDKAARLNAAILAQVAEGKAVTADIGGTATTTEFTDAVAARL